MKKVYWLCLTLILSQLLRAQSPTATTDTATILQFGTVTINALSNDVNNHAGDTLFIKAITGVPFGWTTLPASDTSIIFHAKDSDFTGIDTFYYVVCDKHDTTLCATGTVIITINRIVPLAVNDTASLLQYDTLIIHPLANDSNFHFGDSLCLRSVWGYPFGWASVQGCKNIVFHALDSSYTGYDTLYYRVCNVNLITLCDTASIIVNIHRLVPVALTDSVSMVQPGSVTIHVFANDTNYRVNDTLCITAIWDTIPGWVTLQGCGTIVYHPTDPNFEGVDTFYYSSCDIHATNLCDTAMVLVYVLPLNTVASFTHTDSMCGITLIDHSTHADLLTWSVMGINSGIDVTFNYEDTIVLDWLTGFVPDVYAICLTSSNSSNSSTVCDTVSTGCLGIAELAKTDYRIYPNPATDLIHLDLSRIEQSAMDDLVSIEVYDMIGSKLKTATVSRQTIISVSDLSSGLYILASQDKNGAHRVLGKFEVVR